MSPRRGPLIWCSPIPSYLDGDALIDAARRAGADAVHPGYGFLAENATFAAAVEGAGMAWVGPPPEAITAMGDKAAARRLAATHGVPVVAGYDGPAQDDATLSAAAAEIGWPILVKPSGGGGGKGMRIVRDPAQLADALAAGRREAMAAFGDDRLILERLLEGARHVEVQVLFDAAGHGVHLGERDCSAQRRQQKIVEESPAPSVSPSLREAMGRAALAVAGAAGYEGAGTVEFLLTDTGEFVFLEMNTRLQVEHPVTEAVTGRDLVADQLRIAAGEPLGLVQDDVRLTGHAIEARIYAEDPENGFLPATGRVVAVAWPGGEGVRVDAGVEAGDLVLDRYDPLLAKVIAHGPSRTSALDRLESALAATRVLGVRTNIRFLRWLVAHEAFATGRDADGHPRRSRPARTDLAPARRMEQRRRDARRANRRAVGRGMAVERRASLRLAHGDEELTVAPRAALPSARHGDQAFVDVDGQSLEFRLAPPPAIETAVRHAAATEGTAVLTAPMPGRVLAVRHGSGDAVAAHETVVVLEAMKMEHAISAPLAGTVTAVHVREGDQVQRGDLLAEISA